MSVKSEPSNSDNIVPVTVNTLCDISLSDELFLRFQY